MGKGTDLVLRRLQVRGGGGRSVVSGLDSMLDVCC